MPHSLCHTDTTIVATVLQYMPAYMIVSSWWGDASRHPPLDPPLDGTDIISSYRCDFYRGSQTPECITSKLFTLKCVFKLISQSILNAERSNSGFLICGYIRVCSRLLLDLVIKTCVMFEAPETLMQASCLQLVRVNGVRAHQKMIESSHM
jgi:hypothetical protein